MDNTEKLSLFREMIFEQTEKLETEELSAYKASLKKIFKDHKREKTSKDEIILVTEKEDVRKQRNKQHAQLQLQMQRDLHKQQQKLKEEVFAQVQQKIDEFMETEAYLNLLERQINQALAIANEEEIIIYVDPADADKVSVLEQATDHEIAVSDQSFIGGIQGLIQSRNVLIDYSFFKKLERERDNFSFDFVEEGDEV